MLHLCSTWLQLLSSFPSAIADGFVQPHKGKTLSFVQLKE
jgi:hypothetical protein